jgi:DNA-binding transcriptional MerR regulator
MATPSSRSSQDSQEGFDFKEWYEENGEALNKSRRNRYQTDPEYRQRVLDANRESREKRRKKEREEKFKERQAQKLRDTDKQSYKVVTAGVGEATSRLFSIGAVAKTLGCSVQAVRIWEKRGLLPETPLKNTKGDRLYTEEQVTFIHDLFVAKGKVDPNRTLETPEIRSFPRSVLFKGKKNPQTVDLFRVGELARAISRTVVTVDQMEELGRLPKTPFRASKTKYRLYTVEMINVVKAAMDKRLGHIRGKAAWKSFHDEVLDGWKKLGVMGAKLVR